jgi:hypothetical protein
MKVGILTFHRAINYGAVLQAYALQTALKKIDIQSEVIDYRCNKIERDYSEYRSGNIFRHAKPFLNLQYYLKNKNFSRFLSQYVTVSSDCYYNHQELCNAEQKYRAFLAGSDQVWNPFCTGFDTSFLLDFVHEPIKKNSYAASFGLVNLPQDWQSQCRKYLNDFHGLSVRERQGQRIIENVLGKTAAVHLDPVFLLKPEEWKEVARPPEKSGYILVYLMQNSERLLDFAEELSRKTGCSIVMIYSGLRRPIRAKYVRCAGPDEFVGYIANAKYVITNSFHGAAFSILFHKNVSVGLLEESSKVNSRLENLLDIFDLGNRLINNETDACPGEPIAYGAIEQFLGQARKSALLYLKSAINPDRN